MTSRPRTSLECSVVPFRGPGSLYTGDLDVPRLIPVGETSSVVRDPWIPPQYIMDGVVDCSSVGLPVPFLQTRSRI